MNILAMVGRENYLFNEDIRKLDEKLIGNGKPGPLTKRMVEIFDQYIQDYLAKA